MEKEHESESLVASLLERFWCNLGLKIVLTMTLAPATTLIYFVIQRNIIFPTWKMPATILDGVIPFQPHWVWAYLSLYIMSPIGAMFTRSREMLMRYAVGVGFYSVVGFICFILFPIAAPRPAGACGDRLYEHLIRCDRVYNSVPSLHAACGIFGVLYAAYASRDTSRPRLRMFLLAFLWIWFALILYSTIATRQHYLLDLPPGLALGWLTYYLVLKLPAPYFAMPRPKPSAPLPQAELSQQ